MLTPEEVTRRNEAIALFMGWQRSKAGAWFNEPMMKTGESSPPPFHERYDLLMPVVDKILIEDGVVSKINFEDGEYMCELEPEHHASYTTPPKRGFSKSMIEATWMAVSEWVLSRATPEKQADRGKQDKA